VLPWQGFDPAAAVAQAEIAEASGGDIFAKMNAAEARFGFILVKVSSPKARICTGEAGRRA
jgi:hypothetical protein